MDSLVILSCDKNDQSTVKQVEFQTLCPSILIWSTVGGVMLCLEQVPSQFWALKHYSIYILILTATTDDNSHLLEVENLFVSSPQWGRNELMHVFSILSNYLLAAESSNFLPFSCCCSWFKGQNCSVLSEKLNNENWATKLLLLRLICQVKN